MSEQPKDDKHWEKYRKPKKTIMNSSYKNILLGIVIGVIGTCSVFFMIGDVNIETEIQIGEKSEGTN